MSDTLKEFLRGIILAVIPVIITALSDPNLTLKVLVIGVVIAALRAVDEWLSQKNMGIAKNGISGI